METPSKEICIANYELAINELLVKILPKLYSRGSQNPITLGPDSYQIYHKDGKTYVQFNYPPLDDRPWHIKKRASVTEEGIIIFDSVNAVPHSPEIKRPIFEGKVYIPTGEAWIIGKINMYFMGMQEVLKHVGCVVEGDGHVSCAVAGTERKSLPTEDDLQIVFPLYSIAFPAGSTYLDTPQRKNSPLLGVPMPMQIADNEKNYLLYHYPQTEHSPRMIERRVFEIDKGGLDA